MKTNKKSEAKPPRWTGPKSHHLDRHALTIAAAAPGEDDDTLLTQREMAAWFRCSEQWLIAARHNGYGPPFERIAPMLIRYSQRKVKAWLDERSHRSTHEYDTERWANKGRKRAGAAR